MIKNILNRIKSRLNRPKRYSQLYTTINKIKPINILEVGTWNGRRAVEMIKEAQKHNKDVQYYGFDLFENMTDSIFKEEISKWPPTSQEVKKYILDNTGVEPNLFIGNTMETFPKYIDSLPIMDFIYIDGGHAIETVKNDWTYSEKLMDKNTAVIFDDYWPDRADEGGSKIIVDALDKNIYKIEILPIVDSFDNPEFGKLVIQFAKVTKN